MLWCRYCRLILWGLSWVTFEMMLIYMQQDEPSPPQSISVFITIFSAFIKRDVLQVPPLWACVCFIVTDVCTVHLGPPTIAQDSGLWLFRASLCSAARRSTGSQPAQSQGNLLSYSHWSFSPIVWKKKVKMKQEIGRNEESNSPVILRETN